MRAHTDISLKERRTLSLNEFKGIDLSSSPLDVHPKRAIESLNLINQYGVNRKRNGWDELIKITNSDRIGRRINGIFKYEDYFIVHAGARFFKLFEENGDFKYVDITESGTYETSKVDPSRLSDARSEAYLLKKRLYIVGAGDFLVYGSWNDGESYELRRVEDDEDTYIPTTTININSDTESEEDIRGTLDMPNLLCKKRKNSLVGFSGAGGIWTLDSPIEEGTDVSVVVEVFDDDGKSVEKEYINYGTDKLYSKENKDEECGAVVFDSGKITLNVATPTVSNMDNIKVTFTPRQTKATYLVEKFTEGLIKSFTGERELRLKEKIKENSVITIGFVTVSELSYTDLKIVYRTISNTDTLQPLKLYYTDTGEYAGAISDDRKTIIAKMITYGTGNGYDNTYEGPRLENNITVKYYPESDVKEDEEEEEEKLDAETINGCTFGTLFGAYGNTDRLFLSGNEENPNMDFYSAADDFTYFTDEQTAALGSDASPIGGYARLSDSTLIIYKNDADREASIYYRTGRLDEERDAEGNLIEGRTIFPLTAGTIGETVISRHACANFAGDTLMLSKNGVFGVVLANNVVSAERYTRERSRSINERLCTHKGLADATAVVYENRYYLAVSGVCYVADTRYKYKRNDDIDGSYNYEWWCWDNMPVRVWAVMNGSLCFGTSDGRICRFDEEYTDREHFVTEPGDTGFALFSNVVTYAEALKEKFFEGDGLRLRGADVYALYATVDEESVADGRIHTPNITEVYDGTLVYADEVGTSGLEVGEIYVISDVDIGDGSYALKKGKETIRLSSGGFRLHRKISEKDLIVANKGDSSFEIVEPGLGKAIQISDYNGALPVDVVCKTTHKSNIRAEWYTPIFDLGTHSAAKTLLGMTLTADPRYCGRVRFGYKTKHTVQDWLSKGNSLLAFDDLSFEEFSFDTNFASSYTVRLNRRNVNYVQFKFVSDDDKGCAINTFSLLYKINKNNRGVV